MKKLLVVFLLMPFISFSQSIEEQYMNLYLPKTAGKIVYMEVVDVPGKTADQLMSSTRKWFLDTFKSSDQVIEYENREDGIISGNGNFSMIVSSMGYNIESITNFNITIEVKEEKMRYKIQELDVSNSTNTRVPVETFFSREWMIKKNGKPAKASWAWYEVYEEKIIGLEQAIKNSSLKKTSEW